MASSLIVLNVTQYSVFRVHDVELVTGERNKGPVLCAVFSQGCCRATRWNQSNSNIYRRESQWLAGWHYVSSSLTSFFSDLCEGTKDQLGALTNDIKGNANVVRTKLKCESNRKVIVTLIYLLTKPYVSWCCLLLCNSALWLFPCEAMEQSMPKDDIANRASVDFRIQRTQVRKQTVNSSLSDVLKFRTASSISGG